MKKAREGQLRRPRTAADFVLGFVHDDGFANLCHGNRGRKTIRSGADHHDIV